MCDAGEERRGTKGIWWDDEMMKWRKVGGCGKEGSPLLTPLSTLFPLSFPFFPFPLFPLSLPFFTFPRSNLNKTSNFLLVHQPSWLTRNTPNKPQKHLDKQPPI